MNILTNKIKTINNKKGEEFSNFYIVSFLGYLLKYFSISSFEYFKRSSTLRLRSLPYNNQKIEQNT